MANWFLASEQGCPLVAKLLARLSTFYVENDFRTFNRPQILATRFLARILNRSHATTRFWFSPLVTRGLGIYHYLTFHYLFERLVASDAECRTIWERTRKVPASGPRISRRHGWYSPLTDAIRREFDERRIPMYKLTWKQDEAKCTHSTWLFQLLNGWGSEGPMDRRPPARHGERGGP